jgi:hypothetical protein
VSIRGGFSRTEPGRQPAGEAKEEKRRAHTSSDGDGCFILVGRAIGGGLVFFTQTYFQRPLKSTSLHPIYDNENREKINGRRRIQETKERHGSKTRGS